MSRPPSGWIGWPKLGALRLVGFRSGLDRRLPILALLHDTRATVSDGPTSAQVGLGGFALALDGDAHRAARDRLITAISGSEQGRRAGVAEAIETARAAVAAAPSSCDVLGGVIDLALRRWAETWFGLGDLHGGLTVAAHALAADLFGNTRPPGGPTIRDEAKHATAQAQVAEVGASIRAALPDAPAGTLAHAVRAAAGRDDEIAVGDLLGLTVGPLALTGWAIANALSILLEQGGIDELTDPAAGADAFRRAVAQRPPLSGLVRTARSPIALPGVDRRLDVPCGHVLLDTSAAIRAEPEAARLVFGAGPHECLGIDHAPELAGHLLVAIAARRPRMQGSAKEAMPKAPSPIGPGTWDRPGSLTVSFGSAVPAR